MKWELTLRPAAARQRAPCAWFVPGSSAEGWLAALANLPVDQARARLLIVPKSATDRQPLGALVISEATGKAGKADQRAISVDGVAHRETLFVCAYGCIGGRLFVPVEAVLSPPIADLELKELLADDQLYVWHPTAGLTPFAAGDCLRAADLLVAPAESAAAWDRAAPGVAYNTRLLSLSAAVTPSLEQVIEQVRGEIGKQSHELAQLPPSPREPEPDVLSRGKRGVTALLARFAVWLSKLGSGRREATTREQNDNRQILLRVLLGLFAVAMIVGAIYMLYSMWPPGAGQHVATQPVHPLPPPTPTSSPPISPPQGPRPFQPLNPLGPLGDIWPSLLGAFCLLTILVMLFGALGARLSPQFRVLFRLLCLLIVVNLLASVLNSRSAQEAVLIVATFVLASIVLGWLLTRLFGVSGGGRMRSGGGQRQSPKSAAGDGQPRSPKPAAGGGWLSRLGAWGAAKLAQASESIQAARNREIERLVHLLDTDPDEGLRFALPLAGDLGRGTAPPATRLSTRTVEFGSGGYRATADYWDVQADYRRKLTEQYRTLANREISLGRHRRAAYILAQLLGDWNAAARTLADGSHFREAAIIYDERLQRPFDAAKCLEQGGLLSEAIVIYERLQQYETVGDLYAKLEQPDEAERAYRRAVEVKRTAADRLGAAVLLEAKLHAPEEAWSELVEGWPFSPQAERCLREAFVWTERHQDFDRAKRLLRDAADKARTSQLAVQLVGRAAELHANYPEHSVRTAAAAAVLAVASPRLPRARDAELAGLTAALRQLAPDDKLLSRDCQRYSRDRTVAEMIPSAPSVRSEKIQLRRESSLPFGNIKSCVAAGDNFYAAGWRNQDLAIIRGNWRGDVQYPDRTPWREPAATPETPILMAVDPSREQFLYVHPVGQYSPAYERIFPLSDLFPTAVRTGGFPGLNANVIALAAGARVHAIELKGDELIARCYASPSFTLAETASLICPDMPGLDIPLPLQEREGVLYAAIGPIVYFVRGNDLKPLFSCDDNIVRLLASPPHTRPRLIAVLERGAQIIWGVARGATATTFAQDMARPHVLIHRDGWIIAADRRGCKAYVVKRESLQQHAALEWGDSGEVVALLPLPVPNAFAVCFESGRIAQYQIAGATDR